MARARGAARAAPGATCGGDRRDAARRRRRSRRGATGARARSPAHGRERRGRARCYAALAAETTSTALLAAEALGQRFADAASAAASPAADDAGLAAFGARRRRAARGQARAARHARRSRCASGSTIVRGARRRRAAARRRVRARGRASTTARSTPPSAPRARHDFALRYLTPYRDAVRRRRARPRRRRGAAVRHRAAGVALRRRHRVVGRRRRADAADAGDRALGREAARAQRLPAGAASPTSTLNTQFGAFYFKYWLDRLDAHAGARRRRV